MARLLYFSLLLILMLSLLFSGSAMAGIPISDHFLDWVPAKQSCEGSIGECLSGEEFAMDSEINRRILATDQYISYNALKKNIVPCSKKGQSYYNCRAGGQANPYSRGCSAITRCARDTS
ncbi:hypothetical protein AMTRI_Chr02g223040 [Amborella trichopoda]|uniref:Rapid alkalinization factor 1 n=1 Tax=Amborella trichopoda TaxID=13333 RepID=W1P3J0_AMBTC|nr:protein RALF-like 33 [Amborella trichopoda]ERN02184.1 hypothetical protein AMTR_s00045p00202280 [Amborella trichopoda]|eukprot:XP_006840509.1 protein RALF-like 33 [Amborella trichopoda]